MEALPAAIFASLRASVADFRRAVEGLDASALDWRPAPDSNSIAALVAHSTASAAFWVRAAADPAASHAEYDEERAQTFSFASDSAALLQLLDSFLNNVRGSLEQVRSETLAEGRSWPDWDGGTVTVAWCLVHAAEHFREHVAAAMLTRQLLPDHGV